MGTDYPAEVFLLMRRHGVNAEKRQLFVEETLWAAMQRARGVFVTDSVYSCPFQTPGYNFANYDDREEADEWFYLEGW